MADYTDLLRRAVDALPENNGAARRLVYEKARKALKAQLRAIDLPARDVTQHRLQLEDCIRAVEQQATEQLFSGLTRFDNEPLEDVDRPIEVSAEVEEESAVLEEVPETEEVFREVADDKLEETDVLDETVADTSAFDVTASDADARDATGESAVPAPVSALEEVSPSNVEATKKSSEDELVALLEENSGEKERPSTPETSFETPEIEPKATKIQTPVPAVSTSIQSENAAEKAVKQLEPSIDSKVVHTAAVLGAKKDSVVASTSEKNDFAAMSAVREVDNEAAAAIEAKEDPQSKIDSALAKLDRAANGQADDSDSSSDETPDGVDGIAADVDGTLSNEEEASGGNAMTIFLVVMFVLLLLVGAAGFVGWREGFIDLNALLGQGQTTEQKDVVEEPIDANPSGPGNTTSTPAVIETPVVPTDETTSDETPVGDATNTEVTPRVIAQPNADETKSEDRLPTSDTTEAETSANGENAETVAPDVVDSGSQSLLLEATENGKTGAVPFSGTVEWTRGADELGQPTLIAKANIPARNMQLDLLIRRNGDPTLPASHLIEVDFTVSDSFIGGGVSRIAGVLLKNEELVQGTPLIGASARITANSFLFAMSAAPQDETTNNNLLRTRKWMDLAMLYSTGKQAIITLEKDDAAQALFDEVMAAWSAEAAEQ